MSMVHLHLHLIPAGLLGFASLAQAHPGHTEHAAGLPVGWHAFYHGMELTTAMVGPVLGTGMMVAGLLLYATAYALGRVWRPQAGRIARFTGLALGGGGLWLLLG